MSGSGRKALYLCTHSITSILRITPYSSVHSMSPCLHTCICVVPVAQPLFPVSRPLFPVPVSRQGYAVGPDRGNRSKGNSVNNTIHTDTIYDTTHDVTHNTTDDTTDDTHAMLQVQMILQAQAIYRHRRSTNTGNLQVQVIYRYRRSIGTGDLQT